MDVADSVSRDFREHLSMLLNDKPDIVQFWAWLVDAEADIEEMASEAEVELARMLELRIHEFTSGHIDRDCLVSSLRHEIEASGVLPRLSPSLASLHRQ
jgi:hypothetical protein